jgi:hypothetical protein
MTSEMTLPESLPADPLPLFQAWFREAGARRTQPNPDAMVVATVASNGEPSARVVLCKRIGDDGYVVFFTNYQSRKGRELAARPRATSISRAARSTAGSRRPRVSKASRSNHARFSSNACTTCARDSVSRPAPRAALCQGRRIGAVIACGSKRSSFGRKARTACTTAPCGRDRWSAQTSIRLRADPGGARGSTPERARRFDRAYLMTLSVGLARLLSPVVVAGAGSLGGVGGCGGVLSASEKIIPCPVSRA